jgi:hypothetical protein
MARRKGVETGCSELSASCIALSGFYSQVINKILNIKNLKVTSIRMQRIEKVIKFLRNDRGGNL